MIDETVVEDRVQSSSDSPPDSRKRSSRFWIAAGGLVILALVLRLGYVAATPDYEMIFDAFDYEGHAQSLAQGKGYPTSYGRQTAFRPPSYPFFLAGVYKGANVESAPLGRRIEVARIAQAFVGTGVVALIGLISLQLWGRRMCLLSVLLAAVYLPFVLVGGSIMSEPIFLLWMLASLAMLLAARTSRRAALFAAGAGVFAGLAVLTRANAVFMLPVMAMAVWIRPKRVHRPLWVTPAIFLLATSLTIVPWTIRNAVKLDAFVPISTQLGVALAGTYNDESRLDTNNPWSWRTLDQVREYDYVYKEIETTTEAGLEKRIRSQSFEYIKKHPESVLKVGFWNALRTFDLAGIRRTRETASTISITQGWADAGVICFWIFGVIAALGVWTKRGRQAPRFFWLLPIALFLSVIFIVVETPRYRSPIDPFIVIAAALGISALIDRSRQIASKT